MPATAVQRCARWSSPDLEPGVLSPGLCTSVSSVFGQVQLIPPFQNMLVFREIGRLDQVTFLSLPFPSHLKENKLVLNLVNTCLVSVKMSYLKINIIDDFKDFYYMKNLGLCTSRGDDSVRNLRVPSTTCDDDQFTADLVCPVPPTRAPQPPAPGCLEADHQTSQHVITDRIFTEQPMNGIKPFGSNRDSPGKATRSHSLSGR